MRRKHKDLILVIFLLALSLFAVLSVLLSIHIGNSGMAYIHTHGSISKQEEMLYQAYRSLISFGKLFLPGDFMKSKTPAFHYEISQELARETTRPLALILPREHGKTTLIKAYIVQQFCFSQKAVEWGFTDKEKSFFYGWCSASQRKSRSHAKYVRMHLAYNKRIIRYFGRLRPKRTEDKSWGSENIETRNGNRLSMWSNLSSMRGETEVTLEEGNLRFHRAFLDDTENEENTKTENARENIRNIVMNSIYPAVDKKEGRLIWTATPIHYDCFTQRILDNWNEAKKRGTVDQFMWKVISYPATQPEMEGGVLWHSWYPREELDKIKQTFAESPKGIMGYYQEYELQVQSEEYSVWTRKHIRYHNARYEYIDGISYLNFDGKREPVNIFGGCDPATDINTKSADYSVIMIVAVDKNNDMYVLDYIHKRNIPQISLRNENGEAIDGKLGVVDYIFMLGEEYNCNIFKTEDVAMTRSVFNDFYAECKRRNKWDISLDPIKPGGKEKRNKIFTGLNQRFCSSSIHIRKTMYELENEILTFGSKMAHDDLIETLYFCNTIAYPPSYEINEEGEYIKRRPKVKSWVVA